MTLCDPRHTFLPSRVTARPHRHADPTQGDPHERAPQVSPAAASRRPRSGGPGRRCSASSPCSSPWSWPPRPPGPLHASPAAAAADDGLLKVLLFYKPNFHASHVQARQAVRDLATELGDGVRPDPGDPGDRGPGGVHHGEPRDVDTVVFAQTGGVLFDRPSAPRWRPTSAAAAASWACTTPAGRSGRASTTSTRSTPASSAPMSEGHPENPAVRPGRVVVKDPPPADPGAARRASPAATSGTTGWSTRPRTCAPCSRPTRRRTAWAGRAPSHPITWCQEIDAGRSWYSAMGHEGTAYAEPVIRTQMGTASPTPRAC